jgi:small-conductance mechanosensitive channel
MAQSLYAIRLALGSWPLTLAAVALNALSGLVLLEQPLVDDAIFAVLLIPCLIGLMIIYYLMSRRAGAARPDEGGSVGAWFGWGLLSGLPLIAIMLCAIAFMGFEKWSNSEYPSWVESIAYVVAAIIATPLSTMSTGRAINRDGASASRIFAYCKRHYVAIIGASFALLLIPSLLSDALYFGFGMETLSWALSIFLGFVQGLALMALGLATIGLSATIYRNAEKQA